MLQDVTCIFHSVSLFLASSKEEESAKRRNLRLSKWAWLRVTERTTANGCESVAVCKTSDNKIGHVIINHIYYVSNSENSRKSRLAFGKKKGNI